MGPLPSFPRVSATTAFQRFLIEENLSYDIYFPQKISKRAECIKIGHEPENLQNIVDAPKNAKKACEESGYAVSDHVGDVTDLIRSGKGAKQKRTNVHLSRYACYLAVQNADPDKPIVALGQTYFATQTRRQELADQIAALPEDQRRIVYHSDMSARNQLLNDAARGAGVISPGDFATFTNPRVSRLVRR